MCVWLRVLLAVLLACLAHTFAYSVGRFSFGCHGDERHDFKPLYRAKRSLACDGGSGVSTSSGNLASSSRAARRSNQTLLASSSSSSFGSASL